MFYPIAKIIADSINPSGDRLTTFVLTYHRMIHSEFMTHRMLSKNASSSRAIPVEKMIAKVIADDVYPLFWGKNKKGMSTDEEVDIQALNDAELIWAIQREDAIIAAKKLAAIGIHKQVVNRLLEPFSTITVICSGTEYQNFFNQRCHPDAQPEMQALANAMKAEYDASIPNQLSAGEWHIPFIDGKDWVESTDYGYVEEDLIKVAIGRCARVSYLNHDGIRNLSDDTKLYWRLRDSKPAHLSPFEHCAMALPNSEKRANFTGFESYRHQLEQKGI